VVIPNWHFGTTYQSYPQGSRFFRRNLSSWLSWPLKMGPTGCSETSVMNYHYTLHNIPEQCRSHLLHSGSLKSLILY